VSEIGNAHADQDVVAFELSATEQLYGRCTEEEGCRHGWEHICPPTNQYKAIAGFCNGARYPDGTPL